jgi:hypothetical protein
LQEVARATSSNFDRLFACKRAVATHAFENDENIL